MFGNIKACTQLTKTHFGQDRIIKHLMFMRLKRSKWNRNVVAEKLVKTWDILRKKGGFQVFGLKSAIV